MAYEARSISLELLSSISHPLDFVVCGSLQQYASWLLQAAKDDRGKVARVKLELVSQPLIDSISCAVSECEGVSLRGGGQGLRSRLPSCEEVREVDEGAQEGHRRSRGTARAAQPGACPSPDRTRRVAVQSPRPDFHTPAPSALVA